MNIEQLKICKYCVAKVFEKDEKGIPKEMHSKCEQVIKNLKEKTNGNKNKRIA